ncbi:unnamed protein product [Parnassius apollo]|uniref:(apollo) hypothetical protein n=1 Tax=Parnassius apollo TaxID=110799 RepID=A0A8S3WFI2_PARAO|nr:unnamed protein product [Parnassius apollo]
MPMVTVATLPELDAAEALLELQGEMRELQPERSNSSAQEEVESSATAALFLNSLFLKRRSNLKSTRPGPSVQKTSPSTPYLKSNSQYGSSRFTTRLEPPCKKRLLQKKQLVKPQKASWSEVITISGLNDIKETCDRSTQTEMEYQLTQIDKMESIIKDLCAKIETLENKLKMKSSVSFYALKGRNNVKSKSCNLNSSDSGDENIAVPRTSSSKRKRYTICADSDWVRQIS